MLVRDNDKIKLLAAQSVRNLRKIGRVYDDSALAAGYYVGVSPQIAAFANF